MTLHALSQLYRLRQEIAMDEERVAALREQAASVSSHPTGMPSVPGSASKVEAYAVRIADLIGAIEKKRERCIEEQLKLEAYIASIDDSLTRQIFTLRFIQGLSYRQIASKLHNTEENVRQICCRYVRRHK